MTDTLARIADRYEALHLIAYCVKRLLQTDRDRQPLLFEDRLNDVDLAVAEYERDYAPIVTDVLWEGPRDA